MADAGDLEAALAAGRASLERGPALLPALREAGVVDAGGYALTLMVAGALAASRGEQPSPEPDMGTPRVRATPTYRWCTNVLVEHPFDDLEGLRALGDSLMVARDGAATRIHVHTDDPDAVVALLGDVAQVEVSDMLPATTAFALADEGFADVLASMGLRAVSELRPFHAGSVAIVAEPQAALVASVAFDARRTPEENSAALLDAIARVRTASVPAGGELAAAIAELAPGAELLTILAGDDAPLGEDEVRALVPSGVEVEVTPGAPPPWWWLVAAE
jgi:dihydroxyacetone kinase-like predicted kinase